MSQGHTGFLSDRAYEVDLSIEGDAPLLDPGTMRSDHALTSLNHEPDLLTRAARRDLERRLAPLPLFLPRTHLALTSLVDRNRVSYQARVQDVLRHASTDPLAFADAPGLRFRWPPDDASQLAPRYDALAADGVLRVGAVFGQMLTEGDEGPETGWWSLQALTDWLQGQGYAAEPDRLRPGQYVWKKDTGGLTVEVELRGPDEFPVEGDEEAGRGELRALIQRSEVVYLDGHTRRPIFASLVDPSSYQPPRHRVLVLDTCWSQQDYARAVLDVAADTHVVATDGRVVTGSVGSFAELLAALVAGSAQPASGERWLPLLTRMNDLAEVRARERADKVEERLRPPEVYGVSPAW